MRGINGVRGDAGIYNGIRNEVKIRKENSHFQAEG